RALGRAAEGLADAAAHPVFGACVSGHGSSLLSTLVSVGEPRFAIGPLAGNSLPIAGGCYHAPGKNNEPRVSPTAFRAARQQAQLGSCLLALGKRRQQHGEGVHHAVSFRTFTGKKIAAALHTIEGADVFVSAVPANLHEASLL